MVNVNDFVLKLVMTTWMKYIINGEKQIGDLISVAFLYGCVVLGHKGKITAITDALLNVSR